MSRKHLGIKRSIKQFDKAFDEMVEFINVVNFLPPRGEGAKALAISEWKELCNDALIQFNNIRNTQIELIEREEQSWK